jgi:hypothetical protein
MKAVSFLLLWICLGVAAAAGGKSANGGKAAVHAADVTSTTAPSSGGGGGGGGHAGSTTGRLLYVDPRNAPPMDPQRKVTEQDCTKPVDLSRGNLKCK